MQITHASASTGSVHSAALGLSLEYRHPHSRTERGLPPGYRCFHWLPRNVTISQLFCARQKGWFPPTCRVGEAAKPGPTICSVNPG
eukprot:6360945-Amphidinium_carterae.1